MSSHVTLMLLIRDRFENHCLGGFSRSQEICWVVAPSGRVQHGSPAVWAPTSELFFLPTGVREELFSRSVVSNSLWPHGLQRARPPCPLLSPGVCPSSCPLNQWCHPTVSSSVTPSPAFNLCQHQGLFQWVGPLHQLAKALELQHRSFQWIYSPPKGPCVVLRTYKVSGQFRVIKNPGL